MPEGPEVEVVRRTLAPQLVGQTVARAWVSKFALRSKTTRAEFRPLIDQKVVEVGRHGKLLWVQTENGAGTMIRLGMTGKVLVDDHAAACLPHTHVRLTLASGKELRYVDARRFGDVRPFATSAALVAECDRLGPDPLSFTPDRRDALVAALARTGRRVKDALLDQHLVAGVGNIYACEALFFAGVDPRRRGNTLSKKRRERIVDAVEDVLRKGVVNGGTTLRDYVDAEGNQGDNQNHLAVFQREADACDVCARPIARVVWGGRSTFFCRRCQR